MGPLVWNDLRKFYSELVDVEFPSIIKELVTLDPLLHRHTERLWNLYKNHDNQQAMTELLFYIERRKSGGPSNFVEALRLSNNFDLADKIDPRGTCMIDDDIAMNNAVINNNLVISGGENVIQVGDSNMNINVVNGSNELEPPPSDVRNIMEGDNSGQDTHQDEPCGVGNIMEGDNSGQDNHQDEPCGVRNMYGDNGTLNIEEETCHPDERNTINPKDSVHEEDTFIKQVYSGPVSSNPSITSPNCLSDPREMLNNTQSDNLMAGTPVTDVEADYPETSHHSYVFPIIGISSGVAVVLIIAHLIRRYFK